MAEFKDEPWIYSKRGNKVNNMYSRRPSNVLVVSLLFFFVNPLTAAPLGEFFGADLNKLLEIPKYLNICHRSDKNLDKCIKSSLKKFLTNINLNGEEFNLPSLDPIEISSMKFQLGDKNVNLDITFEDFRIDGFSNFKVTNVKSNLIDSKFEISVENPQINMTGYFVAEGGIYTFPISSEGNFSLSLTDVSAVLIFRLANKNLHRGLSFFVVENCLVDMVSSEINAYFGDTIDGSSNIAKAFNTFFNNNAHEIFTLIKPKISDAFANIFESIANEILSRHPDDVLLPD